MKDIKEGKGTVGALLTDHSVYEDLKILLGNVGRNRSLRALVRYSISRDEQTGRVRDDAPPPAPGTGVGATQPAVGESAD